MTGATSMERCPAGRPQKIRSKLAAGLQSRKAERKRERNEECAYC